MGIERDPDGSIWIDDGPDDDPWREITEAEAALLGSKPMDASTDRSKS